MDQVTTAHEYIEHHLTFLTTVMVSGHSTLTQCWYLGLQVYCSLVRFDM